MKTTLCILRMLLLMLFAYGTVQAAGETPPARHPGDRSLTKQNRQIFGQYVQSRMTEAFNGKLASKYPCGANPAYYCEGLMVSAFEQDNTYWLDPTTPRISFTYFRQDIATALFDTPGFVLWPQAYVDNDFPQSAGDPKPYTPVFRCAFPVDGITVTRDDAGCGQNYHGTVPEDGSGPCASVGVTTGQQWLDKYRNAHQDAICGFGLLPADGPGKQGMDAMIDVASTLKKGGPGIPFFLFIWNEVPMGPWQSNDSSPVPFDAGRLPLMAIFQVLDNNMDAELRRKIESKRPARSAVSAQVQQKRYYDLTGIFVPIIEISVASPDAVFTYKDEDQHADIPQVVTVFPR